MRSSRFFRYSSGLIVLLLTLIPRFPLDRAWAASLTAMSDTLSSTTISDTGVTHTIAFTTATTDNLQQVTVQFATTSVSNTRPAGLDLSSATLGTVTGLGAGWSIDTSLASSGFLSITRASAGSVSSSTAATIPFQNITNSALGDCEGSNGTLHDTCSVQITTYSDTGSTVVDSGNTTYTVFEDPAMSFEVEDIASGQTHNGVTSNVASTNTTVAFGHFGQGNVRYATQKITITTNAPHGYTVTATIYSSWQGDRYVNNDIDPFGATNATWTTPQNWDSPDGSSPNINSGWFGANTSDTGVTGWSSGSGKFGPLNQNPHTIAISTGPARSGDVIYVSYAIEVNGLQAADSYTAGVVYDVVPTF
jgi:hypothetical protein